MEFSQDWGFVRVQLGQVLRCQSSHCGISLPTEEFSKDAVIRLQNQDGLCISVHGGCAEADRTCTMTLCRDPWFSRFETPPPRTPS